MSNKLERIYAREMNVMALLSMAVEFFTEHIYAMLQLILFLFIPVGILGILVSGPATTSTIDFMRIMKEGTSAMGITAAPTVDSPFHIDPLLSLILLIPLIFVELVGLLAIIRFTKHQLEGNPVSVGEAIGEGFHYWSKSIGCSVLMVLLTTIGLAVFILPGIYALVVFLFTFCGVALRDKSGWDAMKYSASLVKNNWWRTFGVLLLVGILLSVVNGVFGLILLFNPDSILLSIIYSSLCYITTACNIVFTTIFFLNREALVYGVPREEKQGILE